MTTTTEYFLKYQDLQKRFERLENSNYRETRLLRQQLTRAELIIKQSQEAWKELRHWPVALVKRSVKELRTHPERLTLQNLRTLDHADVVRAAIDREVLVIKILSEIANKIDRRPLIK